MYLKTNTSPLEAVVVNVGAVSAANSNTAFHVKVLDPVPSWITSIDINWPVVLLVGAANVLLPPKVNLHTSCVEASQATVAWSVSVDSA